LQIKELCSKKCNKNANIFSINTTLLFTQLHVSANDGSHHQGDHKSVQELLENEPHSGRPSTSVNAETVSKVKELVCADRRITIIEGVNEVGISYRSAQAIMT
jgi:hypothetical protein